MYHTYLFCAPLLVQQHVFQVHKSPESLFPRYIKALKAKLGMLAGADDPALVDADRAPALLLFPDQLLEHCPRALLGPLLRHRTLRW